MDYFFKATSWTTLTLKLRIKSCFQYIPKPHAGLEKNSGWRTQAARDIKKKRAGKIELCGLYSTSRAIDSPRLSEVWSGPGPGHFFRT